MSTSQSSLQLATGKAHNEITPDTELYVHPMRIATYVRKMVTTGLVRSVAGGMNVASEDREQALVDLLLALGDSTENVEALNGLLRDAGASIQLQSRESRGK